MIKQFIQKIRLYKKRRRLQNPETRVFAPRRSYIYSLRRRVSLSLLIFPLVVGGLYLFLFKSDYFLIRQVVVEKIGSIERLDEDALKANLNSRVLGANILSYPEEDLPAALLENYPVLNEVRVEKEYPGKIMVFVVERKPLLILKPLGRDDSYLVDGTGLVFSESSGEDLPVVEVKGNLRTGQRISGKRVEFLIELVGQLNPREIKAIEFVKGENIRFLFTETEVIMSVNKEAADQSQDLLAIRRHYQLENLKAKRIDLRFDRPVVTY